MGLQPKDRIILTVDGVTNLLVHSYESEIKKTVGAEQVRMDETHVDRVLTVNGTTYRFGITRE